MAELKFEVSFEEALAKFVAHINTVKNASYDKMNWPETLERELIKFDPKDPGKKYVRLFTFNPRTNGRSCYCFVDKTTGDVLKSASWKAPAKGIRGNIFAGMTDPTKYGVTEYGANYNR